MPVSKERASRELEQRGRHWNQLALLGTRWYAPAELDMSNQSDVDRDISGFLAGAPFAVAGASASREKYGNIVLRRYWQAGRIAYPVNPTATSIEGAPCFPNLSALPEPVHAVSIVTPPA